MNYQNIDMLANALLQGILHNHPQGKEISDAVNSFDEFIKKNKFKDGNDALEAVKNYHDFIDKYNKILPPYQYYASNICMGIFLSHGLVR